MNVVDQLPEMFTPPQIWLPSIEKTGKLRFAEEIDADIIIDDEAGFEESTVE